jgi:hypothetical protein
MGAAHRGHHGVPVSHRVRMGKTIFQRERTEFCYPAGHRAASPELKENIDITKSIERTYSREVFLWRSELAYREQQLSQLYGPAYGYVMSQRKIYALWMDHKMHEVNFDVKKLLSTQNHILRDLIISKSHLIDGPQMPDSFVRFFTSTLVFDLYAAPSDAGSVPEQLKADARYPDDFDDHIIKTTERLRARIEMLHAKFAAPLDN